MSSQPAVAIITRTKDRTLLLRRCVETVLAQSFPDWVHVIVNDGGNAADLDTLLTPYRDRYGARLLVIHHPESAGMEAAANIGVRASQSDTVVILDDDDSWSPLFLERCVGALRAETHTATRGIICHTDIVYERITGSEIRKLRQFGYNQWMEAVELQAMLAWNRFTPVCFLFERGVFDEIGTFDESLPVCGDWDFSVRFLLRYDIAVLPETLAFYHQRPEPGSVHGNTVTAGARLHKTVRARIANRWLRDAIGQGRLSVGEAYLAANSAEYARVLYHSWWRIRTSPGVRALARAARGVRAVLRVVRRPR